MLFEHLSNIAQNAPATSGLRAGEQFFSYAVLVEKIGRLASGFLEFGVGKGDRVAILLPNGPDFFVVVQSLVAIGAIAVPVNAASGEAEFEWITKKCRFRAIICADNLIGIAQKLRLTDDAAAAPILTLTGNKGRDIASFAQMQSQNLPRLGPDTVALYILSSGSTGRPKLVPHTHSALIACGQIATTSLKLDPDDVILNALPAHHAFGFLNGCFEVPTNGASSFFWTDPGPLVLSRKRFFDVIRSNNISVMPGVPYIFQTLSEIREPVKLPGLRLVYSSGIALKREIYDAFKSKLGLPLRQGYGCTETGMLSFNGIDEKDAPWDSVGSPSKGVKVKLLPVEGAPAGSGELFITTPALVKGYVDATTIDNSSFVDGGYLTGDLARITDEGHIYLIGRTKLVIEVAGEKVDPLEIEDILCQATGVKEAVVIGVPDKSTGEQKLKAVIVANDEISAEQLIAFCRARLMAFKVPQIIEFIAEIPKSSTGKVLRGKLMEE